MNNYFTLIIFIYIFSNISIKPEKRINDENNKYFASITALNGRENPNFKSKIKIKIPIGTTIYAEKQNIKDSFNGETNYWYYSPQLDIFIFGSFVSKLFNENNMNYTIYYEFGDEECPSTNRKITLVKNRANAEESFGCQDRTEYISKNGSYKLAKDSIEIQWENNTKSINWVSEKIIKKESIAHYSEKLIWNEKFNGWIEEKYFKLYDLGKCVKIKNRCTLDCSNSCSYINKSTDCIEYDSDYLMYEKHFSFFCDLREKPALR